MEFRAKTAEDFCISKGTAESLDDLALLLGYREFRLVDSQAERICADYVENWRRAYDEAHVLFQDFQQYMGWANGPDTVKYLGRAKTSLEKIITYMHRYKAVEIRLGREQGLSIQNLTVQVELIKEQLRAARQGGGAPGGGGNRGGGGLGGG